MYHTVKMLSSFFSSIFQQQDPAGLAAATDALLVLITMSNFPPSSADDILTSLGEMEPDNYTKQLAKTRLQVLRIVRTVLLNDKSARVLQKRYEGAAFLLPILAFAQKERDPVNLLEWFQTLETVLKNNRISPEVSLAAFESFSPFFPISIRKSTAGGPEATEDELKEALRSCFAANGLLAQHTFSFLLEKLDDGGSLTASSKVSFPLVRIFIYGSSFALISHHVPGRDHAC
jgi:DNA repair/transcription protein MET18/MMS19